MTKIRFHVLPYIELSFGAFAGILAQATWNGCRPRSGNPYRSVTQVAGFVMCPARHRGSKYACRDVEDICCSLPFVVIIRIQRRIWSLPSDRWCVDY